MRNDGSVSLVRVDVTNNSAGLRGGGFSNETDRGLVTMSDGKIEGNEARTSHGGGFGNQGRVELTNVLINANRNRDAYRRYGCPVVSDSLAGYQGPLAGFTAAMDRLLGCVGANGGCAILAGAG